MYIDHTASIIPISIHCVLARYNSTPSMPTKAHKAARKLRLTKIKATAGLSLSRIIRNSPPFSKPLYTLQIIVTLPAGKFTKHRSFNLLFHTLKCFASILFWPNLFPSRGVIDLYCPRRAALRGQHFSLIIITVLI